VFGLYGDGYWADTHHRCVTPFYPLPHSPTNTHFALAIAAGQVLVRCLIEALVGLEMYVIIIAATTYHNHHLLCVLPAPAALFAGHTPGPALGAAGTPDADNTPSLPVLPSFVPAPVIVSPSVDALAGLKHKSGGSGGSKARSSADKPKSVRFAVPEGDEQDGAGAGLGAVRPLAADAGVAAGSAGWGGGNGLLSVTPTVAGATTPTGTEAAAAGTTAAPLSSPFPVFSFGAPKQTPSGARDADDAAGSEGGVRNAAAAAASTPTLTPLAAITTATTATMGACANAPQQAPAQIASPFPVFSFGSGGKRCAAAQETPQVATVSPPVFRFGAETANGDAETVRAVSAALQATATPPPGAIDAPHFAFAAPCRPSSSSGAPLLPPSASQPAAAPQPPLALPPTSPDLQLQVRASPCLLRVNIASLNQSCVMR
jgi:hypothetical protein